MTYGARRRAKLKSLPFALCHTDFTIPEVCPVLLIPLSIGEGKLHDGSPTLDRIDGALGYVPGNVWVISFKANRIKNDATLAELEQLVAAIKAIS